MQTNTIIMLEKEEQLGNYLFDRFRSVKTDIQMCHYKTIAEILEVADEIGDALMVCIDLNMTDDSSSVDLVDYLASGLLVVLVGGKEEDLQKAKSGHPKKVEIMTDIIEKGDDTFKSLIAQAEEIIRDHNAVV